MFLALELTISIAILKYISYTEIDWKAYMEQVEKFINGERDYLKIEGVTGPCVYPAGHLYIFSLLYWLSDSGTNIFKSQVAFLCVYLAT